MGAHLALKILTKITSLYYILCCELTLGYKYKYNTISIIDCTKGE